jgi:uncharacterized coiled-coil protein SlyX
MTLAEAMARIADLEEHIARQNALILKWMLRLAKSEARAGKVGAK